MEVKQRKMELGEEIKNETGGRIYRVVCGRASRSDTALTDRLDHQGVHGSRVWLNAYAKYEADIRVGTMVLKR